MHVIQVLFLWIYEMQKWSYRYRARVTMWIYILANTTVCNCCLIVMILMMIKLDVKLHLVNYLSINMEQTINMLKMIFMISKVKYFFLGKHLRPSSFQWSLFVATIQLSLIMSSDYSRDTKIYQLCKFKILVKCYNQWWI